MEPADEVPARLAAHPTWILNQVSTLAHRLLTEALAREGSRGYDYRVLTALHEFGPTSQAWLGRRALLDRSDVVATVNALAERGYVTRRPDPSDRRRNVVDVTASGAKHFGRLDQAVQGVQDRLLSPLDPDERQTLVELLRRIA